MKLTYIINTIEIAIIIILPLILFYQLSSWKKSSYLIMIPILYLIWYFSYGMLHEFAHMIGVWISGKEILDYQLIPHFWKGQFGTGFVKFDFQGDKSDFLIILMPYLRDLVFVIIGYLIISRRIFNNSFMTGLVLIIFILSSFYDVTNNYLAYVFGYMNDFNALKISSNRLTSNFIGLSFMITSLLLTLKILLISKSYPEKNI
jgi:hypothetical protein